MAKLIILGTSTNIPDATHENTHMVLVGADRMVLIDGPANPFSRLLQVGLDPKSLTDIVVTHFHPDHAGGIPLLLMALGLNGRETPLNLYANQHCMSRLLRNLEDYDWEKWLKLEINMVEISDTERYQVLDCADLKLFSSPVKHFVPTVGIRIETPGKTLVYSGDTAPVSSLDRLASGAEIMIHEAGGESEGHSSASQAGEAAQRSGAKELILVHYPVGDFDGEILVREAQGKFSGKVSLAKDFSEIDLTRSSDQVFSTSPLRREDNHH